MKPALKSRYFIIQGLEALCIHLLQFLLYWFGIGEDRQLVINDGRIYPEHICRGPCEHVKILGQELLELALLSSRELHAYLENSVWVTGSRLE